eukprot:NODE_834_length_3613_cov_0.384178.p1 type:complete len:333 gc:universal NODE_834_length_3613_cov_0.384178:781-1779(+)
MIFTTLLLALPSVPQNLPGIIPNNKDKQNDDGATDSNNAIKIKDSKDNADGTGQNDDKKTITDNSSDQNGEKSAGGEQGGDESPPPINSATPLQGEVSNEGNHTESGGEESNNGKNNESDLGAASSDLNQEKISLIKPVLPHSPDASEIDSGAPQTNLNSPEKPLQNLNVGTPLESSIKNGLTASQAMLFLSQQGFRPTTKSDLSMVTNAINGCFTNQLPTGVVIVCSQIGAKSQAKFSAVNNPPKAKGPLPNNLQNGNVPVLNGQQTAKSNVNTNEIASKKVPLHGGFTGTGQPSNLKSNSQPQPLEKQLPAGQDDKLFNQIQASLNNPSQ